LRFIGPPGSLPGFEALYDLVLKRRVTLSESPPHDEEDEDEVLEKFLENDGDDEELNFDIEDRGAFRVLKADAQKQVVLGVVFEPEVVDTQGDLVAAEEIERACHKFATDYRAGLTGLKLAHERTLDDGEAVLVENYIARQAFSVEDQPVKVGAWLQAWHITSAPLWAAVLDGTLTGFSFGGTGARVAEVAKDAGELVRIEESASEKFRFDLERTEDGRGLGIIGTREQGEKRVRIERMSLAAGSSNG